MFARKIALKNLICLGMALLLSIGLFAGCGNNGGSSDPTSSKPAASTASPSSQSELGAPANDPDNPWSHIDLSEPETINFYVIGSLGTDWERITGLANEKMQEKINTTVNFVYVPWSDFQTKYALFLAGDESVDMIYAAPWCNYQEHLKANAFTPLDWDFISTYMPLTAEGQASESWKEVTYDGKIYGIPRDDALIVADIAVTTRDLMDKYGWKESDINGWDDLNQYLFDIAAGESGTGVYGINAQSGWPSDIYWFRYANRIFDIDDGSATWMTWRYDTGKSFDVNDMIWFAETPEYLEFALLMAEFNKSGVFPADVMSNQTMIDDSYLEGRSAINFASVENANKLISEMESRGKEIVFLDGVFTEEHRSRRGPYMMYAACFPTASKKTERAAVALDCMKFDKEVNRLLLGGIEGEHYTLDETANIRDLGPNAAAYPWAGWCFLLQHDADPALKLQPDLQATQDRIMDSLVSPDVFPINGFAYDNSKFEAEIAVLSALVNEYRFSFCFGIFQDNTEAKYHQFISECKAAGLDAIVADYREQLQAFIKD